MINGKKVLAIIPARGGSKGIPKKNIKLLNGKPLIAWTIDEAKKSQYIDKLIVSSDDDEIIDVSKRWGAEAPFKRPSELAQDDTPGIEPILHAIEYFPEYEYIISLQPTSPLRLVEDIDKAIEICEDQKVNSCVSVTESPTSPYWMFQINEIGKLVPVIKSEEIPYQRQKAPKIFELNGAVYVGRIKWLKGTKNFITPDTLAYVMPIERSFDIDTEFNFKNCELVLKASLLEGY